MLPMHMNRWSESRSGAGDTDSMEKETFNEVSFYVPFNAGLTLQSMPQRHLRPGLSNAFSSLQSGSAIAT
jgi:hypothetical protein